LKTSTLFSSLSALGVNFYAGVPDSLLQNAINHIETHYGDRHWVMPNEGCAVAAAAGHALATGRVPCVYMQNSGLGNAVNPLASLTNPAVYAIPMVLLIGWRGEPSVSGEPTVSDEPQHAFQGQVTEEMLRVMEIPYLVVSAGMTDIEFTVQFAFLAAHLKQGKSVALLFRKGSLDKTPAPERHNPYPMGREQALGHILARLGPRDIVISSTGKISRELFELREQAGQGHEKDFLTVGSMGHCSSIALAVAAEKPGRRVVCIDGDGALLMHMGVMAMIGARKPANFLHIVLDNAAHETVGGAPTVSEAVDFCVVAKGCGYVTAADIQNPEGIGEFFEELPPKGPHFLRIRVALGAREDLGRPTRTPLENKADFMGFLG